MTAKRETLAELELPAGGLAEDAVAAEPPRDDRPSIDDVEFLFFAPDEPTAEEANQFRDVEESISTDFLFSFDRDDETSPQINLAPEGGVESGEFPLAHFQAERTQLEAEIGRLRAELERHRAFLTELREGHSLLLPAPAARLPADGVHLPAAADVLAGLTTVAQPFDETADFRDSEEFQKRAAQARALLGFEDVADGTLLQPVGGADGTDFRALAPIERRLPYSNGEFVLPALRPFADESMRIHEVAERIERPTREIVIPVRWWNAIPAVAAFVVVAVGFGFFAFNSIGQVQTRMALADALHSAPMRTTEVEATLALNEGTFLARFDGRFDYLRARLHDHVNVRNNAQELLSSRRMIDPRVVKLVDRAIERSPGIGWHRLTRAALATAAKSDDAAELWKTADAARIDDPLYWEALGDHYRMSGRHDDALAMFANALRRKPTATRDVLAMLSEVRIDLKKSLAVVPAEPTAALQATLFVRNEEGRRDWTVHASALLQKLGAPKRSEDGDDLAARGQLQLMLGKNDDAASSFELALAREPERNDFRLALAKLRYEQQRFDEAGSLAEKIVHSEPASGVGEEARVLRNKIELSTPSRRIGAAAQ